MQRFLGFAAVIVGVSLGSVADVSASTVLSTGLGPIGTNETNWTVSSGDTPLTPKIVLGAEDYPLAWYDASGLGGANWITPFDTGAGSQDMAAAAPTPLVSVVYSYLLTFVNPLQDVTVQWSSDNQASFLFNGNEVSTKDSTGYGSLTSFTILASLFQAVNTFTVNVTNLGCSDADCHSKNPTGLLVSAPVSAVPLPAALPLFTGALGGFGVLNRWRKRRTAVPVPV